MEDKVLRMIQNDMEFTTQNDIGFTNPGFQNSMSCGTINAPQMSRPA